MKFVAPLLLRLYLSILLVLATTRWIFGKRAGDVAQPISSDPASVIHHSLFTLAVVVLWVTAAIVCTVGARTGLRAGDRGRSELCVGGAILSVVFLVDELFQLHKPLVPEHTGLPATAVLLVYAVAVMLWLGRCRREIGTTDVAILGVALGFFAVWLVYKLASPLPAATPVEISAKLCGVAGWTLYLWRASTTRVTRTSDSR